MILLSELPDLFLHFNGNTIFHRILMEIFPECLIETMGNNQMIRFPPALNPQQ